MRRMKIILKRKFNKIVGVSYVERMTALYMFIIITLIIVAYISIFFI